MHTRRLVAFLLGVWLGGMLLAAYTVNANDSTTKSVLENRSEAVRRNIEISGKDRVTLLLTANTAEINRGLLQSWEWMQLVVGIGVVCVLPFAMRPKWVYLIAAALMVLIVLAQRVLLTPELIGVGRLIDMAGGNAWTRDELWKERQSFHTLTMLYWSFEGAKALIGIGLTAALLIFRQKTALKSRGGRRRESADRVDDSDYSHVDRGVGTPD